jgi:hypothetical protein
MDSQLMKKKVMSHAQSNGTFNEKSHGGDNLRRSGALGLMVPGTSYGGVKCMGVAVVLSMLQSHGNHHVGLFVHCLRVPCVPHYHPIHGLFFSC